MKKVLSFVLSVAMVICLMPSLAFAADDAAAAPETTTTETATATGLSQFSDADDITNKEAVAVLVGLGIIDGMGDGTFQPQGDLTRAQASKLVATLVKRGDKTDIPAPTADPFTDVAKDYWGAGAIQFGVDNGYINGMGDGTFHPEEQVTTAQLATMIEKVLGYTVEDVNYQWPENAMAIAQGGLGTAVCNLLEGVTKGATAALNREEAAQMLFNGLLSDDAIKASTTGGADVEGRTAYSPVPNTKFDYEDRDENKEQLIEKYFPKVTHVPSTTDAFGHKVVSWKNGRTQMTDEVVSEPAYVYTEELKEEELKADLDGYKFTLAEGTLYNGDPVLGGPTDIAGLAEVTGNGKVIELYTNEKDTEITQIIMSDYQPATVGKPDAKNKVVPLVDLGEVKEGDKYEVYPILSSMSEGDKVLVAVNAAGEFLDAYTPTEVTGAITKMTTKTGVVTLGGKTYELAATAKTDTFKVNANDNGTGYLDKYGYLEEYANEKPAELEVADWVLVKDVYSNTSTSAADKYAEGDETTTVYYVLGVDEAGDVVELELNTTTGKGATDATKATYDWATAQLKGATKKRGADGSVVAAKFFDRGELVTYAETADGYTIAEADPSGKSSKAQTAEQVKANAKKIGANYVSTDVKTIEVKGDKASAVTATATDGLSELVAGSQYILKKDGKMDLVTVAFKEKAAAVKEPVEVIRVTEKTANVAYTDKNGKEKTGSIVTYYNEESAEPQEMTITNAAIAEGYFTFKAETETVYTLSPYKSGSDEVEIGSGTIAEAYNDTITVGQVMYNISEDIAVRDLREDGTAAAVADLAPNLKVDFAYTTDEKTGVKTISQLYITGVAEEAAPEQAPAE